MAIGVALYYFVLRAEPCRTVIEYVLIASVWAAVLLTFYSGLDLYLRRREYAEHIRRPFWLVAGICTGAGRA